MTPASSPMPEKGTAFVRVLDQALGEHLRYKQSHLHAYDIGIRAPDLVRYAFGLLPEEERAGFTELLARSPWAISRIAALVIAKRDPSGVPVLTIDSRNQDELEALKALDQF